MKNWKFGVLVLGFMICLAWQSHQEKEAILRLNIGELQALYQIVDESATPGSIRKPLLLKIETAFLVHSHEIGSPFSRNRYNPLVTVFTFYA